MLSAIQIIAERRISQAIEEGSLQVGGWQNKPLPQEDMSHVPPDMRMAYKVLKNAGYLPPEIETKKEIQRLEELIAATEDEHVRLRQMKKLNTLLLKLNTIRPRPIHLEEGDYYRKVVERVSVKQKKS
jgi:hypothetical protein